VLGFVDHHVHLLRVAAGVRPGYAVAEPQSIADYHRRIATDGSTPMDQPPEEPAADDLGAALRRGLQEAASLGLIGITEAGMNDWRHWDALLALRSGGEGLPVSVRILVASGAAELDRMAHARAESDDVLAIEGVKFYADGWLGPRTCACSVPFADANANAGILFQDADRLARRAAPFAAAGWQVATHAIGDRAIDTVLDAYERVYGGAAGCREAAPRIEHAQVLRPDLIARMVELGVVACIQPSFAVSDAESMELALAGRFPEAYRWDLLLDAGVSVIAGSDFPIETLDPELGFQRLITGDNPLTPDQANAIMRTPFGPLSG
jgi:predicted amidohydrolase YtcJ